MFRHRFLYLLVALFMVLFALPAIRLIAPGLRPWMSSAVTIAAFSAMLVGAVFAVSQSRAKAFVAGAFAVIVLLLRGVQLAAPSDTLLIAQYAFTIVFLGYVVAAILAYLFAIQRVDADALYASLCVFLLFGVLWAAVYSVIHILEPGAFSLPSRDTSQIASLRFAGGESVTALYYSFVTLTTLGYGDIVPVTPLARMATVLEAVTGQLYLVVLVARLVGLHITHSATRAPR